MARNPFPQIRNEGGGFPTAPSVPIDTGGPVPGVMVFHTGDAVEEVLLPAPAALEKFRKLELKRDEAAVLVRAAVEDQQTLRTDILGHQAQIKRLTQHPHYGGFGLANDEPRVSAEQARLDKKLADQRRLTALSEARGQIWKSTAELGSVPN
jgi:hypothetical protein